ncbi:hypothetical protein [Spirosoma koreense]
MKTLFLPLLLISLPGLSQFENPESLSIPKPYGDTLKPIEFREIPYTYTTSSTSTYNGRSHTSYSTHSGLRRIYSYDGIDVENPEKELWRYLNALGDPDVEKQRLSFDDIVARKKTASSVGAALWVPGLIMFCVGVVQATEYKKALAEQQQQQPSYYTYTTPPTTTYVSKPCSSWIGTGDGSGNYNWTCGSDPTLTYKGPYPPTEVKIPVTTPGQTQIGYTTPKPTTIDKPTGLGLGVAGVATMLVGFIVSYSAPGNQHSALLKAVQYYNRALKQKFSWEVRPYLHYGLSGMSLVGRF